MKIRFTRTPVCLESELQLNSLTLLQKHVGSSRSKDPTLSALAALEEAAGNVHVSEDAFQYLQAQGINVHDSALQDDGSIVTSALETGQTISLSDAGRLALKGDLGTDKVRHESMC